MSSPPWQDRRGMFQPGKAVHEPARRKSSVGEQASKVAKPGGLAALAGPAPESATRFIYRKGKEVHEPSRKKSMSEGTAATSTATGGGILGGLMNKTAEKK